MNISDLLDPFGDKTLDIAKQLLDQVNDLMASQAELNAKIDALTTSVAGVASEAARIGALVDDLHAQGSVDITGLDAVQSGIDAAKAELEAIQ